MNNSSYKLDVLADGIFAIVMTILVFEIRVPTLAYESNVLAYNAIWQIHPLLLSYVLSFATLFTFWRGYHSVVTDFAKNANMRFQNIAGAFLLFVALVPFSSNFLGLHSDLPAAVTIFGVNVILIGSLLFWMRWYAWKSENIDNKSITRLENNHAFVRILVPVFFSIFAIWVAHINTVVALTVLTLAILFNLARRSSHIVSRMFLDKEAESKKKI